jgi:hypothetical protein
VLFQGLILREKDFRDFIKQNDWSVYENKNVGLICSADAIVPIWAYMLLVTRIAPFAHTLTVGNRDEVEKKMVQEALSKALNENDFENKKVVVKGCGEIESKAYAYALITEKLLPFVSSLMFGEPCSTVPIYKKKVTR